MKSQEGGEGTPLREIKLGALGSVQMETFREVWWSSASDHIEANITLGLMHGQCPVNLWPICKCRSADPQAGNENVPTTEHTSIASSMV